MIKRGDGEIFLDDNVDNEPSEGNKIRAEIPLEVPIKLCWIVITVLNGTIHFYRFDQKKRSFDFSMLKTTYKSSSFDFVFVKAEDCNFY